MSEWPHLRVPTWIAFIVMTGPWSPAVEPGEALPADALPPLVVKELKKKWATLTIVLARKEERNDYVHFHVLLRGKTEERKVEILENGTVVKTEPVAPGKH